METSQNPSENSCPTVYSVTRERYEHPDYRKTSANPLDSVPLQENF
jgi:hypothetical protein